MCGFPMALSEMVNVAASSQSQRLMVRVTVQMRRCPASTSKYSGNRKSPDSRTNYFTGERNGERAVLVMTMFCVMAATVKQHIPKLTAEGTTEIEVCTLVPVRLTDLRRCVDASVALSLPIPVGLKVNKNVQFAPRYRAH